MNITELPGHDNAATVMPKVTHCVSEILHPIYPVEDEVVQRSETPVTPNDDKFTMTRVMFKSITTKALEDQKNLVDATSVEAVKVAVCYEMMEILRKDD